MRTPCTLPLDQPLHSLFLCFHVCILVCTFQKPKLKENQKGTHVVKDSRVFLKLSLPGGTNSLCTFFLFLSFFRSADNSVNKRTAWTCHSFNDNKINNKEFLLPCSFKTLPKEQVMKIEKIIDPRMVSGDATLKRTFKEM